MGIYKETKAPGPGVRSIKDESKTSGIVYAVLSANHGIVGIFTDQERAQEACDEIDGTMCACRVRTEGPLFTASADDQRLGPLGLTQRDHRVGGVPRYIAATERCTEIEKAIDRYRAAGRSIPDEWEIELEDQDRYARGRRMKPEDGHQEV